MMKRKLSMTVILAVALLLMFPHATYAYIDPGTTGSAFAMLAPFAAVALAFLGLLIRPFRVLVASWAARLRGTDVTSTLAGKQSPGGAPSREGKQGTEAGSEQRKD